MYLKHFGLQHPPFSLTPNTTFFCALPGYQAALNTILFSLASGEGFIKVIGEVGCGKTLLCRKLLNHLEQLPDHYVTAYIPNPDIDAIGLRVALAKEIHLKIGTQRDPYRLLEKLQTALMDYHKAGQKVVLIVDEAQALADDTLETLRLLSNLETESSKLIHILLFGQPELDVKLSQYRFRPLKQRIGFSHTLQPLSKQALRVYVQHRLKTAGLTHPDIMTRSAYAKLFKASRGLPRVVNILCHKALLVAYGKGYTKINRQVMKLAILDNG